MPGYAWMDKLDCWWSVVTKISGNLHVHGSELSRVLSLGKMHFDRPWCIMIHKSQLSKTEVERKITIDTSKHHDLSCCVVMHNFALKNICYIYIYHIYIYNSFVKWIQTSKLIPGFLQVLGEIRWDNNRETPKSEETDPIEGTFTFRPVSSTSSKHWRVLKCSSSTMSWNMSILQTLPFPPKKSQKWNMFRDSFPVQARSCLFRFPFACSLED